MTGKIDPRALPGRGKVFAGDEADDAKEGQWSKLEREKMDRAFTIAMGSALRQRDAGKRS